MAFLKWIISAEFDAWDGGKKKIEDTPSSNQRPMTSKVAIVISEFD